MENGVRIIRTRLSSSESYKLAPFPIYLKLFVKNVRLA